VPNLLHVIAKTQDPGPRLTALLIGDKTAIRAGIAVHGYEPVTSLCRALLEAGHDPRWSLDIYRGATLCLRVRSIGAGAALTVEDDEQGAPRFRRYRALRRGAASPVKKNETEAAQ
jgi:hypothetical protein